MQRGFHLTHGFVVEDVEERAAEVRVDVGVRVVREALDPAEHERCARRLAPPTPAQKQIMVTTTAPNGKVSSACAVMLISNLRSDLVAFATASTILIQILLGCLVWP